MSSENDFYFDHASIGGFSHSWETACTLCFSDGDFYRGPIRDAHQVVRAQVIDWYQDENFEISYLLAPAEKVRRRMHLQGYTHERCTALWERGFQRHIAKLEEMDCLYGLNLKEDIAEQKGLSFELWLKRCKTLSIDHLITRSGVTEFEFIDDFARMAVEIDIHEPKVIWTEFGEYSDDLDPNQTFHQNFRQFNTLVDPDQEFIHPTGNVLILTEGKSDTRILSAAIQTLYPEYSDLYQFVDFEEFNISGGASTLNKMVKTFAGVRMDQPILALFDNDAAGLSEKQHLDSFGTLPANIKTMALPDIDLGQNYPTIGPEGTRRMNVNGAASSIELFLGKVALTDDNGEFHPVRWTGWNKQIERYQGALEYKDAITTRFLARMKDGGEPTKLRTEFSEMNQLLNAIFCAFH